MYSALLLLLAPLALSAPSHVVRRQTGYDNSTMPIEDFRLPGFLDIDGVPAFIDGKPVGEMNIDSTPLCNPLVDDVLTCAENKRARLQDPDDKNRTNIIASLPAAKDGSYFKIDYDAFISKCSVSDPQLIHKDPVKPCSIDTCSEKFTSSKVTTSSAKYGMKIGAKQDIKFFNKVELSFTEEFNAEWNKQEAVTTTTETTRTMRKGEICAWTTIQMFINCDSKVHVGKFTIYNADGTQKYSLKNNICTEDLTASGRAEFVRGQGFDEDVVNRVNQVCQDVRSTPTGNLELDYSEGTRTGGAWTIEGCMFE